MTKSKSKISPYANLFDVISLLLSVSVLTAITQHVDHLNQLAGQLVANTSAVNVKPDFQLTPLVFLTVLSFICAFAVRKRFSTLLLIALAIFASAVFVGLFGIHFAHPGVSRF